MGSATDNFNLDLYDTGDPAALTDQYNSAMHTIDSTLQTLNTNTETININANNALKQANTNKEDIANINANLNALGANTTSNATNLKNIINTTPNKRNKKLKCVMFGDSWTVYNSNKIMNTINSINSIYTVVKNYGISGATIQDIQNQINTATSDKSINPDEIDIVIVIAGTNNVFWNKNITFSEAASIFTNLQTLYKNAITHYFPTNSKTANTNRNSMYNTIINGAEYAGCVVHAEFLYIIYYSNFEFFLGDDTQGVQHLTQNGYNQYARWIVAALNGTDLSALPITYTKQFTVTTNGGSGTMDIQFNIRNGILRISGGLDTIPGNDITNLQIKAPTDNTAESNPFVLNSRQTLLITPKPANIIIGYWTNNTYIYVSKLEDRTPGQLVLDAHFNLYQTI